MPKDETTGVQTPPPELDIAQDALFLDFDGCLVEIAPRPDAVMVPPGLPAALTRIAARLNGALAIVSGRTLAELERYLSGFDGPMVGSHGAEARGMDTPMAEKAQGLAELQEALSDFARRQGLLYEPKTHGGGLHFRTRPQMQPHVESFAAQMAERFPAFEVQPAKMAVEMRPAGFSKDRACALLADLDVFARRRPVYAGDDTTDEPALEWAGKNGGYGIKIGEGHSVARHRLAGPGQMRAWLAVALEG